MSHHSPKYVALKVEHMIHLLQVADAVGREMEHPALREAVDKAKRHLIYNEHCADLERREGLK